MLSNNFTLLTKILKIIKLFKITESRRNPLLFWNSDNRWRFLSRLATEKSLSLMKYQLTLSRVSKQSFKTKREFHSDSSTYSSKENHSTITRPSLITTSRISKLSFLKLGHSWESMSKPSLMRSSTSMLCHLTKYQISKSKSKKKRVSIVICSSSSLQMKSLKIHKLCRITI